MKRLMKWFRKPSALGRTPARRPESFHPQLEALGGATASGRPAARRPCPARPEMEVLEAREVPAQISGTNLFNGTDHAVAAIDAYTHHVVVYDWNYGTFNLGGNATDVSWGGNSYLFVRNSDGSTTGFSQWSWMANGAGSALGGWVSEISAGQSTSWPAAGRVFGIGGGHRVYVNTFGGNGSTWQCLGGWVSHISAGLDDNGNDVVFAIGSNGYIYGHDANSDPNGSRWYLVDSSARFTQLSATVHDHVFAIDQSGKLHEAYENSSLWSFWGPAWQDMALTAPTGNPVTAVSAAAYNSQYDEVYVIDTNMNAYVYHTNSGWNTQPVDYGVSEITTIGADKYYDVSYGGLYFEIGNYWNSWYYGGPVL